MRSDVDWSTFREPFCDVGRQWSDMLPALCTDAPPASHHHFDGRWLAEGRKRLGISQRELARRVGCHEWDISAFEIGRYRPSLRMRELLVAALLQEAPP